MKVKKQLLGGHARVYEVLERRAVAPLIGQHLNGEQNRCLTYIDTEGKGEIFRKPQA